MTKLEDLMLQVVLALGLFASMWFCAAHYGDKKFKAGYAAAVASGEAQRESEAVAALAIESGLRAKLGVKDAEAFQKDQDHAQTLAAAQRRVLTGADRLRCPASPVQPAAAAGDRPAAAAPAADGPGPDIVPEAAADVLGIAADVAGLVRRYGEVVERYEECRTVNAK